MTGFVAPPERIYGADKAERARAALDLFRRSPIPEAELLAQLGLFINRPLLTRMLFMHEIFTHVLDVHGVVMEFGVRWGQNLALFSSFRGMYEPYNYTRKVIGFDTFSGFPSVNPDKDGSSSLVSEGVFDVPRGYEQYLDDVLEYHQSQSPLAEIRKHELVKGDVHETVPRYLEDHPETIVALAYFDLDLYEPTKACLEAIRPHLTKGSVIAFDQVCDDGWPGETVALRETLGLGTYAIRRMRIHSVPSYIVVE
jgi:hypothetical protein